MNKFDSDGGTTDFKTAMEYCLQLGEDVSIMVGPDSGKFHVIRSFDVIRRVRERKWRVITTVTMKPHIVGRSF